MTTAEYLEHVWFPRGPDHTLTAFAKKAGLLVATVHAIKNGGGCTIQKAVALHRASGGKITYVDLAKGGRKRVR